MRQTYSLVIVSLLLLLSPGTVLGDAAPVSDATQECLGCHAIYHPGIVADWQLSKIQ